MTDTQAVASLAGQAIELDEKATKAPWTLDSDWTILVQGDGKTVCKLPYANHDDGLFITFSRSALPTLAREVLRLTEENERLTKERDNLVGHYKSCLARDEAAQSQNAALRERVGKLEAMLDDLWNKAVSFGPPIVENGEEYVRAYLIPAGPLHRLRGVTQGQSVTSFNLKDIGVTLSPSKETIEKLDQLDAKYIVARQALGSGE